MTDEEREGQSTCGEGLAAQAAVPDTMAQLISATADVLDRHTKALDMDDDAAREEFDAYTRVVRIHRTIAGELSALASQMARYRDLPMGRHDEAIMTDPEGQAEAFERFVAVERELVGLLSRKLEEDEAMLASDGQGQ